MSEYGKKISWACKVCDVVSTDYASQRRGSRGQFCSLTCARKYQMQGNTINKGAKRPKEWRLMMSKRMKGKNSPSWRGGVTPLNACIRKSSEYKQWRKAVYERDDYTCQICYVRGNTTLNADHIKPFAYFPELRFELSNGRTLCVECHRKTDTYGYSKTNKKITLTVV